MRKNLEEDAEQGEEKAHRETKEKEEEVENVRGCVYPSWMDGEKKDKKKLYLIRGRCSVD